MIISALLLTQVLTESPRGIIYQGDKYYYQSYAEVPREVKREKRLIKSDIVSLRLTSSESLQEEEQQQEQKKIYNYQTLRIAQESPETDLINVIEVIADNQEYDQEEQVITARGNVEVRFPQGILKADQIKINIEDRLAVAIGNVTLTRGEQTLLGERFEYNFLTDSGTVKDASGEIYQPTITRDFQVNLANDGSAETIPSQPLSDRLTENQPLRRVRGTTGYQFVLGSVRDFNLLGGNESLSSTATNGSISRLRFQAEEIDFDSDGWVAEEIRFTNDPFSPPELEVRADRATFTEVTPELGILKTQKSRVVFDQTTSLPLVRDRLVIDERERRPGLIEIGFDGEERGGLFIQRTFELVNRENIRFQIIPQYLLQKAILPNSFTVNNSTDLDEQGGPFNPAVFGFKTDLAVQFSLRNRLSATTDLPSLQLSAISDKLRGRIQLRREIGNIERPYILNIEYNYRERLFNGSLGFQTVQSSFGAVFVSPTISLGDTGINLTYQGGLQNIEANTDRDNLVGDGSDLTTLLRLQGAVSLNKDFYIWRGQALPPTAEAGLRYTPVPVRPFVRFNTNITGVTSIYGNGDTQPSLRASVGFQGQLGNFSRPFFDYTGFNLAYSQGLRGDESPFLFDRFVDRQTISLGLTQQIYGPVRLGVQTSFNLDSNDDISTDYFLEYSRRTYNIYLRYNPVLQIGSLSFRINDFNWEGNPDPFDDFGIQPVIQGVTR